ncbi:MAG: hypothetical protein ACP5D0_05410 [Hydrogenovibrio sp.]
MHYQVTPEETHLAKNPHHIFNINIIITHLFISMIVLEIGTTMMLLAVPVVSSLVIAYIYQNGRAIRKRGSWFVSAHWELAWRRCRILLYSYAIAVLMVAIYVIINQIFPGGLKMVDFSEGGEINIGEIITIRFAAVVIFIAVLITFMQTGISVYDAGKGIIDPKIAKYLPRDDNANAELGEGDDEVRHDGQKQMGSSQTTDKDPS